MEIKAELLKPYTEDERMDFIVTNNHQLGYKIKEVETGLQAWGYTEEELAEQEKERIAELCLTKREVFLGLRKAKGIMPEQIRAKITDEEAQIEFDYAEKYYRGNHLIDIVGGALGLTPKQLDNFFETNNYLYLTDCTLTINPTPVDATVTINDVIGNTVTVPYSTPIVWSVSKEGYKSQNGGLNIKENTQLDITLEEIANDNSTDKQPTISDEVQTEGNK